ncbi:MAG: hypothetical protein ABIZ80_23660 [Bryobacteraceae bacterium]
MPHECSGPIMIEDGDRTKRLEASGPHAAQIAEARGFAFDADALMKIGRVGDGGADRERDDAGRFKLPDIVLQLERRSVERPHRGDQVTAHEQEACAGRGHHPLVEACAEVVALKIGVFEWELGEAVRAVDDGLNAAARAISQMRRTGNICPVV